MEEGLKKLQFVFYFTKKYMFYFMFERERERERERDRVLTGRDREWGRQRI